MVSLISFMTNSSVNGVYYSIFAEKTVMPCHNILHKSKNIEKKLSGNKK